MPRSASSTTPAPALFGQGAPRGGAYQQRQGQNMPPAGDWGDMFGNLFGGGGGFGGRWLRRAPAA